MNALSLIRGYFSGKRDKEDVYCQSCGNELTETGGDVSESGRVYCNNRDGIGGLCLITALRYGMEGEAPVAYFYPPDKLQKAIRRGAVTEFSKLEKAVEDHT